ncbi:hypothetical protein E2C01_065900 [Portunus trituberculatus]|uniref:Uncharacterized protein n=1 Tax=Portunus trituberculatus TaxID=210409 RepID=A0A5B7HNU7_PORTR|nr:hypothetical protein [Portunus trituberculatus]
MLLTKTSQSNNDVDIDGPRDSDHQPIRNCLSLIGRSHQSECGEQRGSSKGDRQEQKRKHNNNR